MKFAWHQNVADLAAWNSGIIEEVDLEVYEDMLSDNTRTSLTKVMDNGNLERIIDS